MRIVFNSEQGQYSMCTQSIKSKSCYDAFFCVLNGRGLRHKSHMKANYSTCTSLNLVGNVTKFCYKMIYSFAIWKKEVQKSRWKIIFTSNSLHLSTQQYFTCAAKLNTHFEKKIPHYQKSSWAALWMYTQGSSWSVTDPEGFISLKYYPLKDFSHPPRTDPKPSIFLLIRSSWWKVLAD